MTCSSGIQKEFFRVQKNLRNLISGKFVKLFELQIEENKTITEMFETSSVLINFILLLISPETIQHIFQEILIL